MDSPCEILDKEFVTDVKTEGKDEKSTTMDYNEHKMSAEDKVREQNRIRQLAFKARATMPKDYKSFCLVASHLVRNAHRYYSIKKENLDNLVKEDFQSKKDDNEIRSKKDDNEMENNQKGDDANTIHKKLREIRVLKSHNRTKEQQEKVDKLLSNNTYRAMEKKCKVLLKTLHGWCSIPKEAEHKSCARSRLCRTEFENFLMQDTVTYSHPCKKYAGKRFLMKTWDDIYKQYLQQPQYHTQGVISKTSMRTYKPKYVLLSGQTPVNQCLCNYCENCQLLIRALIAAGMKNIPSNKYQAVEQSLCTTRYRQFGTGYTFCVHTCTTGHCNDCRNKLKYRLEDSNADKLKNNPKITWHRWQVVEGKSVPQKCEVKRTLKAACSELVDIVEDLSSHLFRANWHRNLFEYIKNNMQTGYVIQIMDFAMNFNNWYQDEVQSAYWDGTQTSIHATMNFFLCPNNCGEVVTLALVHITDNMKHDSFLTRAAQNLTFQYLVNSGVPLDLIIQFCDNCASQYKSRCPFAELSQSSLDIICVFFGEKHGKSHADALFGRLKAWMSYKIKARHFIVKNGRDFYRFCREFYQTQPKNDGSCQHYRIMFEFIRPSDVKRHHDCDLETAVEGTHDLYSVCNTIEPLKLKVRSVPCLCPPCLKDDGQTCLNKHFTDPW